MDLIRFLDSFNPICLLIGHSQVQKESYSTWSNLDSRSVFDSRMLTVLKIMLRDNLTIVTIINSITFM